MSEEFLSQFGVSKLRWRQPEVIVAAIRTARSLAPYSRVVPNLKRSEPSNNRLRKSQV